MTLSIGDHLVIKRNGVILSAKDEAYHEYEVVPGNGEIVNAGISYFVSPDSKHTPKTACVVKLEVVE